MEYLRVLYLQYQDHILFNLIYVQNFVPNKVDGIRFFTTSFFRSSGYLFPKMQLHFWRILEMMFTYRGI